MTTTIKGGSLLVAVVLSLAVLALYATTTPAGRVLTQDHAVERHGALTVSLIRECIGKGPAAKYTSKKDDNIFHWTCKITFPDGSEKWCVMIVQAWSSITQACDFRECTSFCPGDGSLKALNRHLLKNVIMG